MSMNTPRKDSVELKGDCRMRKHYRACPSHRASVRTWEVLWEVNGELFYDEVEVSVFVTAPELIYE